MAFAALAKRYRVPPMAAVPPFTVPPEEPSSSVAPAPPGAPPPGSLKQRNRRTVWSPEQKDWLMQHMNDRHAADSDGMKATIQDGIESAFLGKWEWTQDTPIRAVCICSIPQHCEKRLSALVDRPLLISSRTVKAKMFNLRRQGVLPQHRARRPHF